MIPILHTPAGVETRLQVTYNGLTLNSDSDTYESTSQEIDTYMLVSARPVTGVDYVMEPRPTRVGALIVNPHKIARVYLLSGIVFGYSFARLMDKIEALCAAFDPDTIAFKNADPFIALNFYVPTLDTTNFPTGIIDSRYYACPQEMPEPTIDPSSNGRSAQFIIRMMMKDPRRVYQTTSSKTGAGAATNLGDFRAACTSTITMAGAGSATYSMTNTATTKTTTLTLNLSGLVNGNVVTVDHDARTITVGGSDRMDLYVSGDYFSIEPGTNTMSYANTTNATSVQTWRHSWSN